MSKQPLAYEGMSKSNCADGCREDYCVITHAGHCAHPNKGALQAAHQRDRAVLKRFNEAKDYIAKKG